MKCEDCGSTENLFKITIISPCGLYTHQLIYCNEHTAIIIRENPTYIESIERITNEYENDNNCENNKSIVEFNEK